MNVPAARQVGSAWPHLLQYWGGAASLWPATVHGAWMATCQCILAGPDQGEPIPRILAALYKASLGLNQSLLQALLRLPVAHRPLSVLGDGELFVAWCDREGLLLGQAEVCAGSPQQIAAAWDALLSREGTPPPVSSSRAEALGMEQAGDLALMASTYQGLRRGESRCDCAGCRMLSERPEAWMDCPPDRLPEEVLGLYPSPPEALVRLIDALDTEDHAARETAWRQTRMS